MGQNVGGEGGHGANIHLYPMKLISPDRYRLVESEYAKDGVIPCVQSREMGQNIRGEEENMVLSHTNTHL